MPRFARCICLCNVILFLSACHAPLDEDTVDETNLNRESVEGFTPEAVHEQVISLCGACHPYPEPSSFPRRFWPKLVDDAYGYYRESTREDLKKLVAPPIEDVISYYVSQAPEEVQLPEPQPVTDMGGLRFRSQTTPRPRGQPFSAVAHLRWVPVKNKEDRSLLICDMASGKAFQAVFEGRELRPRLLAELDYPDHIERCDLDADGNMDFVVADLGTFEPKDHDFGRVVWLRGDATGMQFEPTVIQDKLGRVADVRPADMDNDGDLDLVVGEFGWRKTGRVLWFEQVATGDRRFQMHVVDERHGVIHVPIIDLNNDGLLDFVALISQEHETIIANLNRGDGTFGMQQIFGGPGPSYGSSGIALSDLDDDGDVDVLYTNGDSFDTFCLQPYHCVQWLENRGEYPFTHHVLTYLPGAYRALACDLDNDGDKDIAVAAMRGSTQEPHNSLLWLEQHEDGTFVRHNLDYSKSQNCSMTVGDFDGNGFIDLAVGHFAKSKLSTTTDWITFWWNDGPESGMVDTPDR